MKKTGKVLLYTFITFIILLVFLIIVAVLAEKKIVKLAFNQLSKTINVPVQVDEFGFTLIHDFPYATIECKDLLVSSPQTNEVNEQDTLFFAERLFISVKSKPLLKSIFEIRKVEIANARFFYSVDAAGVSNFDFLTDTTQQNVIDTSDNAIFLDIKDLKLNNVVCYYTDLKQKASAKLILEEIDLTGLIDNEHYTGEAKGKAILSDVKLDSTNLYRMEKTILNIKMAFEDELLSFENSEIQIDEDAYFTLNGSVNLGDSLSTEMLVKGEKLNLGNLSKYIPEKYMQEHGVQNFSGMLTAEASISGLIADSLMPAINADFDLQDGILHYQDYPELSHISLNGKATNGKKRNNATTSVDITSLKFQTINSKVNLNGNIKNLDKPAYKLNSTIDLDLQEIEAFIPDSLLKSIEGKVKAVISTKGVLPDSISDEYINLVLANSKVSLQIQNVNAAIDSTLAGNRINAQIEYQPNEVKIDRLNAFIPSYNLDLKNVDATLFGDLTKPDLLDIRFNNLLASMQNSDIELSGTIKNPMTPDYSVSGQLNLDLAEIKKFIPDSVVNSISGKVAATFTSAAQLNLDSIGNQINELLFERSNFTASFDDVNVNMPDTTMNVTHLTGQLEYHSDTFQIDRLELTYQGLQMGMNSVTASNVYSAVLQNQRKELSVNGSFNVGDLDYAFLEQFMELDTTRAKELEDAPLNFTFKINGNFKANSVKYDDAIFQNIDTKFLLKPTLYVFDSLTANAFDGRSLSSVKIEMKPDEKMDIFFKTDISKMNVSKMINGFGQYIEYEDISAQNIQGILSTKMDGKFVFQDFEPVYNSLLLNGDLTIENGALLNVKPVMEAEKINVIGLKNMDSLYFSTLSSSIFIFNREVYIPRTEIKSTSFDAMFLGMYSFGEDYEYHIRMFLGEVLSSKSKSNLRKQAKDDGFGEDVEMDEKELTKGRTSIYLVSKSEDGKEKAGFDTKQDRANMKAKVNLQKQMVDMRFHPALVKYNTEQ